MPENYRASNRGDKKSKTTYSQSATTNLGGDKPTVSKLLSSKEGNVFSIRPQDTLGTAVEALRDKGIGALLVTDATGALKGILSERDIVRKLAETPGQTLPQKVEDVMTSKVDTCAPEDMMVSVLQRMTAGRYRHMPVVDGGRLVGMVTIGDVVNYRLTELEHEATQLKQLIVG